MIERFAQMPSSLRANARWQRLGATGIPVMLVHPDWDRTEPAPVVIWMHGRTANKELDPGRYLRWVRAAGGGIGACAVDLPGHGERHDSSWHDSSSTPQIVRQMIDEIDEIVAELAEIKQFDTRRMGIGGMSVGGMATLARLCRPHPFVCGSVEATSGSWTHHQLQNETFTELGELNPMTHLDGWREIPLQAIHSKADQWVAFEGQAAFIDALRGRYSDPSVIDFVQYENTGAPGEHIGFGRMASDAKDRQRDFFRQHLLA